MPVPYELRVNITPERARDLIVRLIEDADFRQRVEADPRAILSEYGIEITPEALPERVIVAGARDITMAIEARLLEMYKDQPSTRGLDPEGAIQAWIFQQFLVLLVMAAVGILFFGVLVGVLLAVVISVLVLLRGVNRMPLRTIGRLPGGGFAPTEQGGEPVPGVLLVRPEGELYFANVNRVTARIERRLQAGEHVNGDTKASTSSRAAASSRPGACRIRGLIRAARVARTSSWPSVS